MSVWQWECEACGKPFERQNDPHTRTSAADWHGRGMILCDPCYHAAYYRAHKERMKEQNKMSAARHYAAHRAERLAYVREYKKKLAERRAA